MHVADVEELYQIVTRAFANFLKSISYAPKRLSVLGPCGGGLISLPLRSCLDAKTLRQKMSHRIFSHMHVILNGDEKNPITDWVYFAR